MNQNLQEGIIMEYIFSVEEATQKLFSNLSEATGWKYLKSQRCLKKTVEDLVFEIDFFSSKWNLSHQSVEVNAEFSISYKSYGKLPVNNVIATMSYRPELYSPNGGYWYDISTEEKLVSVFEDLNNRIQNTAVSLCTKFENDYLAATENLFREHFDEYKVHLDFIADKLGISVIQEKAQEIYDSISDEMKRQALEYKNGARNESWMINRCNLKYILDKDLVKM